MENGPKEGSIETGEVARIEPYGAFVQLNGYSRIRGLLHISQIAEMRLEKVEDALAVGDQVWVKVVEVTTETIDPSRPPRLKIRLTMKGITQDGTAREQAQAAHNSAEISHTIEQNLNSTIGMGVARDPMANSGLILKNDPTKKRGLINGYALVDDTEGEPPVPELKGVQEAPAKPIGRGRGTTLPAWMTQKDSLGSKEKSKEDKKKKKSKHRKRDYDSDEKESKHRKKHKSSRSDRKHDDRKHKRKRRDRSQSEERHKRSRKSSRRRSSSFSEGSASSGYQFQSVDEAKKLVEKLERKSRE